MSMRTKFHGLKSLYAEDVLCYTEGASNYMGLLNQRLRWKKGRFDTFIAYRQIFFSWKRHHNKPLSWFVLPYALIAELQLLLEPIGVTLLATYSKEKGMGPSNRGRYSNPELDAALDQALATIDPAKREVLLQRATEIGIGDLGVVPLFFLVNNWATRPGFTYAARSDGYTLAVNVTAR